VWLDITRRGRAAHRESLAIRHAVLAAMLSQLPAGDLDALTKALAPLLRLCTGEPGKPVQQKVMPGYTA
jgi:DNA-binding MarR family transcriptional regulator